MNKEDLFEQRRLVGTKLFQLMNEKETTRTEICEKANVSKPTFNKLLNGELSNRGNFYKHLDKVLEYLDIEYDEFVYSIKANNLKKIIEYKGESVEEISHMTDIEQSRLQQIIDGEEATLSEYRDIAFVLETSIKAIQGREQFEIQVADYELFHRIRGDKYEDIGSFWKTLGILLNGCDDYLWFPVTNLVLDNLNAARTQKWLVLPCMGNKVLLINRAHVKEMIFVDEADMGPAGYDWDTIEAVAFIPQVIIESLDDYILKDFAALPSSEASDKFKETMDLYFEKYGWNEDEIYRLSRYSTVYFADGSNRVEGIDLSGSERVLDIIDEVFFWRFDEIDKLIQYYDMEGSIYLINADNVAMMEFPLAELESAMEEYRGAEEYDL